MKKLDSILVLLFASAIAITIYSCNCKEACTVSDWQYTLRFKGFSDSELGTPILKRYAKGTGFIQLRDSILLMNLVYAINYSPNDTTRNIELHANDSTDYKVIVSTPTSGTYYYYLSEMSFPLQGCKSCSKTYQVHMFKSCLLNGALVNNLSFGVITLQK